MQAGVDWTEFRETLLKDPAFKREYDALEDWYQEELARQRALDAADEGAARPAVENTESLTACV
jgi:hypothetical protein